MARTKNSVLAARRARLSALMLQRIVVDVSNACSKFQGRTSGTRLKIEKFSPAGTRVLIRKDRPNVKYTKVYVELTAMYPFDKPKLFFTDGTIVSPSILPTGQYMDQVSWSPTMNICEFLDCVRHELLSAP